MFMITSISNIIYNNFLIKEIQSLYRLYRPYFGLSGESLKRTLSVLGIISSNLVGAFSMIYVQDAFSALNTTILTPHVTLSMFSSSVLGCCTPIVTFAICFSLSWIIASW